MKFQLFASHTSIKYNGYYHASQYYDMYILEPRQRRPTQCFKEIMSNLRFRGHVTLRGHVTPKSNFQKLKFRS